MLQRFKRISSSVFLILFVIHVCASFAFAGERVFDNAAEYEEALTGAIDPDDEYILIKGDQSVAGGDLFSSKSPLRGAAAVQASTVSSPVYPDFDLSTIDLNSIPTNIYQIIQSDNRFVLVQVWSSSYRVFVARNGYLYYRMKAPCDSSGTITGSSTPYRSGTLFGFGVYKSTTTDSYWSDSCLYSAIYNFDGSLRSDWTTYTKTALASQFQKDDHLYIYTGELSDDTCDFYVIGDINAGKSSNSSFTAATFWTTQSGTTFYGVQAFNSLNRYTDSHYVKSLNSFPSFESQSSDTQKGILGFLKSLKNYLLYFSPNEVSRPDSPFANVLEKVKSFTDELSDPLDRFSDSISENLDNVTTYIESGSDILDRFLNGVPIVYAVLLFVLTIIVIRKVVGR